MRFKIESKQAELGIIEAEPLLDADADDREDRPHGKADGEGDGRQPKRPTGFHA